jgi:hypothetical protein
MAVENKIVTHVITGAAADKAPAGMFLAAPTKKIKFNFTVAAADDDGSIYRFARVSLQAILTSVKIKCTAITAGDDYDIGAYKTLDVGGAVIDKDNIKDGQDLSSAITALTEVYVPGQTAEGKRLFEVLGLTAAQASNYGMVDLAFTGNTVGTAAGTISGEVEIIESVA